MILGVWQGAWDGGRVVSVARDVHYTPRESTQQLTLPCTSTLRLNVQDDVLDYYQSSWTRHQSLAAAESQGANTMIKVGIVLGSTRPGRNGEAVARWTLDVAKRRTDAEFELVDLLDYNLPLLDEPMPPAMGNYTKEHTKVWSAKIDSLDGFVFVTAEYNHGIPAALKNAIDFLAREWNDKAAGFVSYGSSHGSRAVEHLRGVLAELQVATVRAQLGLSLLTDFEQFRTFTPTAKHEAMLTPVLDQVVRWGGAMRSLRDAR